MSFNLRPSLVRYTKENVGKRTLEIKVRDTKGTDPRDVEGDTFTLDSHFSLTVDDLYVPEDLPGAEFDALLTKKVDRPATVEDVTGDVSGVRSSMGRDPQPYMIMLEVYLSPNVTEEVLKLQIARLLCKLYKGSSVGLSDDEFVY